MRSSPQRLDIRAESVDRPCWLTRLNWVVAEYRCSAASYSSVSHGRLGLLVKRADTPAITPTETVPAESRFTLSSVRESMAELSDR